MGAILNPFTGRLQVKTGGGGGGGGIVTINGNTGSVTGNPVTLTGTSAGGSVRFNGAGSTMTMQFTNANSSTFLGSNAGNGTATSTQSVALGSFSLGNLSNGVQNTAVGAVSGGSIQTGFGNSLFGFSAGALLFDGDFNTLIGSQSGSNLIDGNFNLLLGYQAGINYTGSETNNILLSNDGVVGENDKIRIGHPSRQNLTYIVGPILSSTSGNSANCAWSFEGNEDCGMLTDGTNTYLCGSGFPTISAGFNVTLSGGTNTITQGVVKSSISSKNSGFTTAYNEYIYIIDTSGGAFTGQLVNSPITGQEYIFKDNTNTWATNNFTLSGVTSGKTIDGAATLVGNVNGASLTLIYNGVQWNVI